MNRKTFRRAEHSEKGMISIESNRSPRSRITRVPMIAGTLQPKPISESTKERPSSPSRSMKASIK